MRYSSSLTLSWADTSIITLNEEHYNQCLLSWLEMRNVPLCDGFEKISACQTHRLVRIKEAVKIVTIKYCKSVSVNLLSNTNNSSWLGVLLLQQDLFIYLSILGIQGNNKNMPYLVKKGIRYAILKKKCPNASSHYPLYEILH